MMNQHWSVQDDRELMDSPMNIDGPRHDFFQVVPPTPRPALPPRSMSDFTFPSNASLHQNVHPSSHPHSHLRPSHSIANLSRGHRSTSSITSIDSHQSFQSGLTGWSTITNTTANTPDGSDTLSSEKDDLISVSNRSMSFSSAAGEATGLGLQGVGSLSIDPRLFQQKDKNNHWDAGDEYGDGEDEEEDLPTAIPFPTNKQIGKSRKTAKTANAGDSANNKKKISHARKQHPEHIPRPRNAFILFRKHVVDSKLIPPSVEMRHQNVSIITAKMWSEALPAQKAHFNELARIEKEEHAKKYPGYRYQPVYRRTNVIRRRVRKDEAEEEKCKSVAELLLKGKSGEALESEIKEKILHASPPEPLKRASAKQDKPSSRRGSAACELSKGALRALRAQARQQGSMDWSDASRGNSVDNDVPSKCRDLSRRPSTFEESSDPNGLPFYGNAPHSEVQIQVHSNHGQSVLPQPSESTTWAYPVGQWHDMGRDGEGYIYSHGRTNEHVHEPQQYTYPQPQAGPIHSRNDTTHQPQDFYKYDQALPFSPNLETTFSFPQTTNNQYHPSARSDIVFGGFNQTQSGVYDGTSPTAATHFSSNPMSARWDRSTHHLLPPSSEVPLDALPFDDGDGQMLLQDFESALTHGGEVEISDGAGW